MQLAQQIQRVVLFAVYVNHFVVSRLLDEVSPHSLLDFVDVLTRLQYRSDFLAGVGYVFEVLSHKS